MAYKYTVHEIESVMLDYHEGLPNEAFSSDTEIVNHANFSKFLRDAFNCLWTADFSVEEHRNKTYYNDLIWMCSSTVKDEMGELLPKVKFARQFYKYLHNGRMTAHYVEKAEDFRFRAFVQLVDDMLQEKLNPEYGSVN